jgi:hypothetical protein
MTRVEALECPSLEIARLIHGRLVVTTYSGTLYQIETIAWSKSPMYAG